MLASLGYLLDTNRASVHDVPGLVDLAVTADQAGLDTILLPERHMREDTVAPASSVMLGALAVRTARARIGTCATVMSLHNPMLMAEELAQVDVLSGGRLLFSGTLGYHPDYWRFAGVDATDRLGRFEESMDVLVRAWTDVTPWSHRGAHWTFQDVVLTPRPVQRPRPPIWVGGMADAAVTRAARWGDAWVADPFPFDPATWTERCDRFRRAAADRGRREAQVALIRQVIVAASTAVAERRCRDRYLPMLRFYFEQGLLDHHPDFRSTGDLTVERARPHVVMGSPDDCVEAIARFTDMGLDHLVLKVAGATATPLAQEAEEVLLLGESVLPLVERSGRFPVPVDDDPASPAPR